MIEGALNAAIVPAIIAAAISFTVLYLTAKRIEPGKWRRDVRLGIMEKEIDTYGSLLGLLDACREKMGRQPSGEESTGRTHLLEVPVDSERIRRLFFKNRRLLAADVIDEYNKMEKDERSFFLNPRHNIQPVAFDLSRMHDLAKHHYDRSRNEFEEFTGCGN